MIDFWTGRKYAIRWEILLFSDVKSVKLYQKNTWFTTISDL